MDCISKAMRWFKFTLAKMTRLLLRKHMFTRSSNLDKELIPGLPNEITVNMIIAKVPWVNQDILSEVSLGWRQAIQNRTTYDARVRNQSTETFSFETKVSFEPVGYFYSRYKFEVYLICQRTNMRHLLPRIPGVAALGILRFVSFNGKLYAFGGPDYDIQPNSTKIYVLDLVGQRPVSWMHLTSHSFPDRRLMVKGRVKVKMLPCRALSGKDGQLFVHAFWYKEGVGFLHAFSENSNVDKSDFYESFYQSNGLCNESKEIVWEKTTCPCPFDGDQCGGFRESVELMLGLKEYPNINLEIQL